MSLFGRLVAPAVPSTRRAYSFFSNKPGGGRYFTSTKPPKIPPANAGSVAKPDPSPQSANEASTSSGPEQHARPVDAKSTTPSSSPSTMNTPLVASTPVPPPSMPFTTTMESVALHSFFAFNRPLLLLPLSTKSIFAPTTSTTPSIFDVAKPEANSEAAPSMINTIDNPPEASPEADADAARLLARSLVLNRIGGAVQWSNVLQKLGDREATDLGVAMGDMVQQEIVHMDSVKRKRKRKMSKHKYKKRRKAQRAERRRLGK